MDPVGLDSQGFAPGASSVEEGAKDITRSVTHNTQGVSPLSGANRIKVAAAEVSALTKPKPAATEDRRIKNLRKVEGLANGLYMVEFGGMAVGGILGWVAGKFKATKLRTVFNALGLAPLQALRETKLNELHHLPGNFMHAVEEAAKESGGKAAEQWAPKAAAKAAKWTASSDAFAKRVAESRAVSGVIKPLGGRIDRTVTGMEKSSFAKNIESRVQKFTQWRAKAALKKYAKHVKKANHALTEQPKGIWKKITGFFTGGTAETFEPHPALSEVTTHLESASAATGAEAIEHLSSAQTALKAAEEGADKALKGRIAGLGGHIEQSLHAAQSAHFFQGAESQEFSGLVKLLGKAPGRLSALAAIVTVGVTAGIAATALTHRKESKEAKAAFESITADIGDDSHPLMENIKHAYGKQKRGHLLSTGFSMAGDVANGALMASPQAIHGAAVMPLIALPMVGQSLVQDNPLLNAYANLKRDEQESKLSTEEKIVCLKTIIGGAVPSVVAHGGIYNRLVTPVAEVIIAQNLSARDTMRLLADDAKFTALASDIFAKQKAAAAPVAPVAETKTEVANDNHADHAKPATKAEAAYHAAPKPSSLTAGSRIADGVIAEQQRAASV